MKKNILTILIATLCLFALGCINRGSNNMAGQHETETPTTNILEYETEKFEHTYLINNHGAYKLVDKEQTYQYKFFVPYGSNNGAYSSMSLVLSNKPIVTTAEVEQLWICSNFELMKDAGFIELCHYFVYADCTVDDHGRYVYQGNTYNYIYQFFDEDETVYVVLSNKKDITLNDVKKSDGANTDEFIVFSGK